MPTKESMISFNNYIEQGDSDKFNDLLKNARLKQKALEYFLVRASYYGGHFAEKPRVEIVQNIISYYATNNMLYCLRLPRIVSCSNTMISERLKLSLKNLTIDFNQQATKTTKVLMDMNYPRGVAKMISYVFTPTYTSNCSNFKVFNEKLIKQLTQEAKTKGTDISPMKKHII